MTCPHLTYRTDADGHSFEEPRAYCTVADRFVQPMRADVCNDRYDLDHAADCELFLANADGDEDGNASESVPSDDGGDAE